MSTTPFSDPGTGERAFDQGSASAGSTVAEPADSEKGAAMAPLATTATQICDRHRCPAPALRTLLINGQDFYFCRHHSAEVERALTATYTTTWMAIAEYHAELRQTLPRRTMPALRQQRTAQQR
jgi:hypothetical protein